MVRSHLSLTGQRRSWPPSILTDGRIICQTFEGDRTTVLTFKSDHTTTPSPLVWLYYHLGSNPWRQPKSSRLVAPHLRGDQPMSTTPLNAQPTLESERSWPTILRGEGDSVIDQLLAFFLFFNLYGYIQAVYFK